VYYENGVKLDIHFLHDSHHIESNAESHSLALLFRNLMIKAIPLDLDNTLVLDNEPEFYGHYFAALAKTFADLIPPQGVSYHRCTAESLYDAGSSSHRAGPKAR
jgi:hypothetical protein